jgi:cation transport ATPase
MIAGVMFLAGCSPQVNDNVTKVVEASKQICSFVPTDATVVALIKVMGGESAHAIATAICNAVTAQAGVDTRSMEKECPKVKDVCIEGEFVEGEKK